MDANIESYPPKMEDTIMKSTESYLNNNDTLEHYNGHCADIGAYKDHLDRETLEIQIDEECDKINWPLMLYKIEPMVFMSSWW